MKAPSLPLTLLLGTLVTGCAALGTERPPERNATLRLDRGLAALDAGAHREAFDDLAWVYSHCAGREAAARAAVALAALELDPRNRAARPDIGTDLLGRVIRDPATAEWVRPLAETAFLAALALGAPAPDAAEATVDDAEGEAAHAEAPVGTPASPDEVLPVPAPGAAGDRVYGCGDIVEVDDAAVASLPRLPGPSMAELLAETEAEREAAQGRADSLQQQLVAVEEELSATRSELERIRKTLKP